MKDRLPYFFINADAKCIQPYISSNEFTRDAELTDQINDGNTTTLVYLTYGKKLKVSVIREAYDGCGAVRQHIRVENISDEDIVLDTVSSLFVSGIGSDGEKMWYDDRFVLHKCHFTWQGEGQWRTQSLSDVGLYPTYNHDNHALLRIVNAESWSTCNYYPMVMLEDKEMGRIWYFEQESQNSWTVEISSEGYRDQSALCVFLSSAYERCGGWHKTLHANEAYETNSAVYGCCDGSFEDAIKDLCIYKRLTNKVKWDMGYPYVCFNDYMNCLWGLPTREKLIPLIDKAHECNCEVFCIDDGWYKGKEGKAGGLGTWDIDDSLFGDGGLKSVIEYIASKGMKPGIWLELESATSDSFIAQDIPNSLMLRHKRPVGANRCFVNFSEPKVKEYLEGIIDRLYSIGIRYIKNDYNQTAGEGFDGCESLCEGIDVNTRAFMSFIAHINEKYPDLAIECCSSGAMRCDTETVRSFTVQSTSDQEFYENVPSVVQGILTLMPPEKAGIWAYPYPVPIMSRMDFKYTEDFQRQFADGSQTVYNMVSGMFGCLYMSGRICHADEYNTSLIKEAVSLYKRIRPYIIESFPIYPMGLARMEDNGYLCLGLRNEGERSIMLGIWKKDTCDGPVSIDMSKYADALTLDTVYPSKIEGTHVNVLGKTVNAEFGSKNSAVFMILKY